MKTLKAASILLLKCSALSCSTYATYAVVGGQDANGGYIALVSPTGDTSFPAGIDLTQIRMINSVAVNGSGASIVGGQTQLNEPFFALISPSGQGFIPPAGPDSPVGLGNISSVAINSSGTALIGGGQQSNAPYAAFVSPTGVLTTMKGAGAPTGAGGIEAVAINDSGYGIIGGGDSMFNAYVGVVDPTGNTIAMTAGAHPLPANPAIINSVAINSSGLAIVGGDENDPNSPYVARVAPNGQTLVITNAPTGDGVINSVAINASGHAIIGGASNNFDAYAALIDPSGQVTPLGGPNFPPPGTNNPINAVAINNSGAAIIGGRVFSTDPYVALVSPDGSLQLLTGDLPSPGVRITSVAINDAGVAIVGGGDGDTNGYLALVSPSGVATNLSGTALPVGNTIINSVAIEKISLLEVKSVLDAVVPRSWGTGSSFATTLFALSSNLLPSHMQGHPRAAPEKGNKNIGFVADASKSIRRKVENKGPDYSVWGTVFGDYAHQKRFQRTPAWTQWLGGAFLGFDYWGISHTMIGCGVAYAYSTAKMAEGMGHSHSNQELVTLYGSWFQEHFYIDWALWGGVYQLSNKRHSIASITSKANARGWLALPHVELGFPFYYRKDRFAIVPFGMVDWASNWQNKVREKGRAGFNLVIPRQYTSLLRSELGLRFLQTFHFQSGDLLLQEKGSYVNKTPFHASPVSTFFVGSASSFTIDTFSRQKQNLGAIQVGLEFVPRHSKWPYAAINYQAEFGTSFQTHFVSLEVGKDF